MKYITDRYSGIQDTFKSLGAEGCHFLVLCSIAEEFLTEYRGVEVTIDLIGTIRIAQSKGWIRDDFYVKDALALLRWMCMSRGVTCSWVRTEVTKLGKLTDRDYSEVVYYNERTGYKHFRRRYVDTINNSTTVREGRVLQYNVYTVTVEG